jgi:hypothetical protein
MTEKQFQSLKLSAVCSYEAYQWLERITLKMQGSFPYPTPVKDFYYKITGHRQYLSKFLESVIVKLVDKHGGFAKKVETTGVQIKTKTGKQIYVKAGHKITGEPDVMTIINGQTVYFEVKVGWDELTPEQIGMIIRLESAGAKIFIVRTVDDILNLLYKLKLIEK